MRWIAAVAAAIAGMVVALVAAPSGVATPRPAACLLICPTTATATATATTTTTTTTTAGAPPLSLSASSGSVGVSGLAPTGATFSAGFDPGITGATYQFQVLSGTQIVTSSPAVTVSPGATPTPITYTAASLTPNTAYTVQLSYTSTSTSTAGAPSPTDSAATAFTTPLEPAAVPQLAASAHRIEIGQSVSLTATATANPLGSSYLLQDAVPPAQRFSDYYALAGVPRPVTGSIATGQTDTFLELPTRNVRLRLLLPGTDPSAHPVQQPSVSPAVLVDVFPQEGVTVSRPHHNAINEVAASLIVHTVAAGFRGEEVYFYESAHKTGRQRLIGHARLHRTSAGQHGESTIGADVRFSDPDTFYVSACIRHAALADMGTPFTDAACGGPTLAAH